MDIRALSVKLGLVIIVAIPTKNSIVVTYIDRYTIHKYTYNNRTVIEYLKKNHLYYVWSLLNAL